MWQRFQLAYAYGIGIELHDPNIEMQAFYPKMTKYYGIWSGFTFSISFITCGLYGGYLADRFNRVRLIGITCILGSLMTYLQGAVISFELLFLFRFSLGMF